MKIAVFSSRSYDRDYFNKANKYGHELTFFDAQLNEQTAPLIKGHSAVCAFVNDVLNRKVLEKLRELGVSLLALRCAGFNNLDISVARDLGLTVVRVPNYSPHAVAEHSVGLILALNRKIHQAHARVRDCNFELEGLEGFDMHGKVVGIIGTGKIGAVFAGIIRGFGCKLLGYDLKPNPECEKIGVEYVSIEELFKDSDIISLHCPLIAATHYLINEETISMMKDGVMIINSSRGKLIDTNAVINGIKSGKIGYLGIDVYEGESGLFFENMSAKIILDVVFARLLTFPNVLVTGHQAFLTDKALITIAETTLENIANFEEGKKCKFVLTEE